MTAPRESEQTPRRKPPSTDRSATFEPAEPGRLADQPGGLIDDDGTDIREYTGEPIETDDGWVLPQQQNVGTHNVAKTDGDDEPVAIRRGTTSGESPRNEDLGPEPRAEDAS